MKEHSFEYHKAILRQLFDPSEQEITFPEHASIVEFTDKSGETLIGIVAGKSIAIPLSKATDTDSTVKEIVLVNTDVLLRTMKKATPAQASNMLGLAFNGETDGFYSDSTDIGTVIALHIHPKDNFQSQAELLQKLTCVLVAKGVQINVKEFADIKD